MGINVCGNESASLQRDILGENSAAAADLQDEVFLPALGKGGSQEKICIFSRRVDLIAAAIINEILGGFWHISGLAFAVGKSFG
jgi:hypothetical protein